MALSQQHPPVKFGKIGVLIVNLGTPDSTSWWDIRRYLKEFLSDARVIEVPRLLWWMILNGPILTFRPSKTAKAYKKVWMEKTDESPLRYYTRMQGEKLAAAMGAHEQVHVEWAMRYGNPSMKSKIHALHQAGCDRIVVVPLYPQYAAATSATVADETFRTLMEMRWQPTIRIAEPYGSHPVHIKALAETTKSHLATLDWKPDLTIASFHGIPQEYFEKGDPYQCYCHKTARLLREELGWEKDKLMTTFQSRFGPREWLKPYTDKTLKELAESGVKKIAVIMPGFAADCIETLEEIGIEARHEFLEAGGEEFTIIPCLNDSAPGIEMLKAVSEDAMNGWA